MGTARLTAHRGEGGPSRHLTQSWAVLTRHQEKKSGAEAADRDTAVFSGRRAWHDPLKPQPTGRRREGEGVGPSPRAVPERRRGGDGGGGVRPG